MEQFKRAKVFVLETNQPPQIGDICYSKRTGYFINEGNTSVTNVINMLFVKSTDITTYKMYITEYKEIEDKDYFIVRYNENTFVLGRRTKSTGNVIGDKVITILGNHIHPPCDGHCGDECVCTYPHPSPDFVIKWIDEANKGNIITDILVEYEYLLDDMLVLPYWNLKVNPKDNTITIRKVKDNYTKEEVTQILEKYTSFIWSEVGIHYPISLGIDAKDKFINNEL